MPILSLLLLLVDATCVIHAARNGRLNPWAWVIMLLPGIGAVAYVMLVVVPEWGEGPRGRRIKAGVAQAVSPEKRYRDAALALEIADTAANRHALASEAARLGRHDEAIALFDALIGQPMGDEPKAHEDRARVLAEAGRAAEAVAALDRLKARWPDYESPQGHLLYAEALAASGRGGEAETEYRALLGYFAGPEPALGLVRLLASLGRPGEARLLAADYVRRIETSPKFTRTLHAEVLRELRDYARR